MTLTASLAELQSKSLKRKFESLSAVVKIKEKIEATVQQLADAQMDVQRIGADLVQLGNELGVLTQHYSAMETAHEENTSKWTVQDQSIHRSKFENNTKYLAAKLALAQQRIALEKGHVQLLNLGIAMEKKEAELHTTEKRLERAKLHMSHLQSNIEEAEKEFEQAGLGLCEGAVEAKEPKKNKLDMKSMTMKSVVIPRLRNIEVSPSILNVPEVLRH
jgi:chromosome segregation ATPase